MEILELILKIERFISIKGISYSDSVNDLLEALIEDSKKFNIN